MAATNPYSQSGLIQTLRDRGISTADASDDTLGGNIVDALNDYNFYRPQVSITTAATCITTVANQPNYDKPTDATMILGVCWNPDYANTDFGDMWEELLLDHLTDTDPTVMIVDYLRMSQYHKFFNGFWELRNNEIWLKPCPSGVHKVAVIYGTSRTLDELDEIGDRRFTDLAFYTALHAVATKKITGGGWKAGQFSISESVGRETMKVAEKGLERTRLLLANSTVGGRS